MKSSQWIETDESNYLVIRSKAYANHYWYRKYAKNGAFIESGLMLGSMKDLLTAQTCCGGKGGERYDNSQGAWFCRDCGAIKSRDPRYYPVVGQPQPDDSTQLPLPLGSRCECGSSKVGSDRHSQYCPLFDGSR